MRPAGTTKRRLRLHGTALMALLGAVGAGIVSLLFGVGRGIGFLSVRIEEIPGQTLSNPLGFESQCFDWAIYLLIGAVFGILYRVIFRIVNRADGTTGAILGLVQYLASGVLLGLLEPVIPTSIQMLPSQPPLRSGMAFLSYVWIILLHVFYGWYLGVFASRNALDLELELVKEQAEPEQAQAA